MKKSKQAAKGKIKLKDVEPHWDKVDGEKPIKPKNPLVAAALPKIEWGAKTVALSQLKPYEKNPRVISDSDYAKLKKFIQEDGYHQRIIATRDLEVIGGHARLRVLKELGFKKVEVLIPKQQLNKQQFRKIFLRDNIELSMWDNDMMATEFSASEVFDAGMSEEEINKIFGAESEDGQEVSFKASKKDKRVTCPECKHRFIPSPKKKGEK